jgi:hypothetical protein
MANVEEASKVSLKRQDSDGLLCKGIILGILQGIAL